jgi:hypothetical protein
MMKPLEPVFNFRAAVASGATSCYGKVLTLGFTQFRLVRFTVL